MIIRLLLVIILFFGGCIAPNREVLARAHADRVSGMVLRFSDTHSMEPLITSNSIGVAIQTDVYHVGDVVVFRESSGRYICHRIISQRGNEYLIKGDNTVMNDGWFQRDYIWYRVIAIY